MKISLYSLLLLFITSIGFAQNDKPQRNAFTLKLAVDDKQYYQMEVPQSNYFVHDKILQIYASESIFIECTLQNDTIATMKVVKKIVFPERTIQLDFEQQMNGKEIIGMSLNVKNPFDKNLLYDAHMYIVGHDKWIATSIIPIRAKLESFENWSDVVITMSLDRWRFVK